MLVDVCRSSFFWLCLLPQREFQAWAFLFSIEWEFIFCIFRMIFASSGHFSSPHMAFPLAIVCACSGGLDGFRLILRYMFLACMGFCILLFSAGPLCSCVTFSRSFVMSKFICLLLGACVFVRIMLYFMSIFMVLRCILLLGFAIPLVCALATQLLCSFETSIVYLSVTCFRSVSPSYEISIVSFFGQKKVFATKMLLLQCLSSFVPFPLMFSLGVVHFPIVLFSFSAFLLTCPLLSVAQITMSFFLVWYSICFMWPQYSFLSSAALLMSGACEWIIIIKVFVEGLR